MASFLNYQNETVAPFKFKITKLCLKVIIVKSDEISRMSTTGMKIQEAMTTHLVTISPNKTVSDAVKIMVEKDVECLPVVKDGILQGLITFRDMIEKVVYVKRSSDKTKVRDIMTKKMITCSPEATIVEAVKLMKNKKLRRIPVVGEDGKLIGLVTDFDLAIFGWEI